MGHPRIKGTPTLFFRSISNFASDSIDCVTPTLESSDSIPSSPATFVRPLKEVLQVIADVIDGVQVKSTVGAENRLFVCSNKYILIKKSK